MELKESMFVESPDKIIVRQKYHEMDIRLKDTDCTRKRLVDALRTACEWA
ncbi:MAG: hypothetical protein HXO50_09985 [Prevotella sp.]|nr:hypothetical protein [Prevotella nigrescens]ELX68039.1 hypothetical protein HMPREF0662_00667 [Prevotella nigrescens F0103]MBF1645945.1 hypothetical protein [Prevotella sp.]QUB53964.1 hypothetical protein J4865_10345 [Prevotella nigrescens F0103]